MVHVWLQKKLNKRTSRTLWQTRSILWSAFSKISMTSSSGSDRNVDMAGGHQGGNHKDMRKIWFAFQEKSLHRRRDIF